MPYQRVYYTTSRSPSVRSRSLVSALARLTPSGTKLPRGKTPLKTLLQNSLGQGGVLVSVTERSGNPAGLTVWDAENSAAVILFDGVDIAKGIKALFGRNKADRLAVPSETSVDRRVEKLRVFFGNMPVTGSRFPVLLGVSKKDDREIVRLEYRNTVCVTFHFWKTTNDG